MPYKGAYFFTQSKKIIFSSFADHRLDQYGTMVLKSISLPVRDSWALSQVLKDGTGCPSSGQGHKWMAGPCDCYFQELEFPTYAKPGRERGMGNYYMQNA